MNKVKVDLEKYKFKNMFERFMQETNPSVCVTGCFDITNLCKYKSEHSLNAMLCYCISRAGQDIDEMHYSIGQDKELYYYNNVKTNAVVIGADGNHYYVDYKYCDTFAEFEKVYRDNNEMCIRECKHYSVDNGALIATSAVINYPFESFSLGLSDSFWDHFMMWGKYIRDGERVKLNITLRFHHALLDGLGAGKFFNELQKKIDAFEINQ